MASDWNKNQKEELKEAFYSGRTDGWYIADRSCIERELQDCDERVRARLTTWLIDQRQLGIERPEVDKAVIEKVKQQRDLSEAERANRLLRAVKQRASHIGEFVELATFTNLFLSHSESTNKKEVEYLAKYLIHCGWLLHKSEYSDSALIDHPMMLLQISVEGYAHLAELDAVSNESEQAFVAMWFGKTMEAAWAKGIQPAVEGAGYKPIRIDKEEAADKIDDQIIAEIRRSRFLVADFTHGETGARGGVYYEAGFAHGLDIPVIFSCRKDCMDQIHFDTRQYNHIDWEKPEDLKDRLVKRICAVIGDGPHKT